MNIANENIPCCICLNNTIPNNPINIKCIRCNSTYLCIECMKNLLDSRYSNCPICKYTGIWFNIIDKSYVDTELNSKIEKININNSDYYHNHRNHNTSNSICHILFFTIIIAITALIIFMIYSLIIIIFIIMKYIY